MNNDHAFLSSLVPLGMSVSSQCSNTANPPLYPVEQEAIAKAVPKRRREFAIGRACAREALSRFGATSAAIPVGADRAPIWPDGYIGSITHCNGFVGAVVARRQAFIGVGVDVEQITDLDQGVIDSVAAVDELVGLSRVVGPRGPLIAFCAKEAVHKCIYPLWGAALDFLDVEISAAGTKTSGEFRVRPATPKAERWDVGRLRGGYRVWGTVVGAAVWLRASSMT